MGKMNIHLIGWQFVSDACNDVYKKSPPHIENMT